MDVLGSSWVCDHRLGHLVLGPKGMRCEKPYRGAWKAAGMLDAIGEPVMIDVGRAHQPEKEHVEVDRTSLVDGVALAPVHVRPIEEICVCEVQDQQHCSYVSCPEGAFQQYEEGVRARKCHRVCQHAQHAFASPLAMSHPRIEAAH